MYHVPIEKDWTCGRTSAGLFESAVAGSLGFKEIWLSSSSKQLRKRNGHPEPREFVTVPIRQKPQREKGFSLVPTLQSIAIPYNFLRIQGVFMLSVNYTLSCLLLQFSSFTAFQVAQSRKAVN